MGTGRYQLLKKTERRQHLLLDPDFEFDVMPFGLCNTPATFQTTMDSVLAGLKWNMYTCLVYLDDVLVFFRSFDEHLARLEDVFKRFRRGNLKLN